MKELESLKYFYFKIWLDIFNPIEFKQWINTFLQKENLPKHIFPLVNLNDGHEITTIHNLVDEFYPDFNPLSKEGELFAIKILLEESNKYLNREITPLEFCKLFFHLEANFNGLLEEYPEWLGDLFEECDYCDESWNFNNRPDLATEIERNIEVLKKYTNAQQGL
ncbi:hypothetical protein OO013_19880 [Mangrovivirga sp. M17]|uniref:Uncharacterized protein n=1 Tax=Mangrovivirga halotolerans TaxID=2993936 RepID=A0ABT3RWJ4_9BACT|nr:hypothetical protein [Mangrovivirga halotolerans]MCX2746149.1 hypothetical protein [Mangrovivirga halotolerans]